MNMIIRNSWSVKINKFIPQEYESEGGTYPLKTNNHKFVHGYGRKQMNATEFK